ncbi:MAG: retropepsin-like aspartic protease [Desulfobacula sp.]|jgi:predicted aspartyl protease
MKTASFLILFTTTLFFSSCVQPQAIGAGSDKDIIAIPFTVSKSQHILSTVEINGKKAFLMIDTGASSSVIHIGKLEYLGLESHDKKGKASGIGTSNYDMKEIIIPEMILNSVSYRDLKFDGIDLYHIEQVDYNQTIDGIIGGDFLKKHEAVIDYKRQILYLRKP